MKNVFNNILKYLHKYWDLNLSIILFILYIIIFFPYKIFDFIFKNKNKSGWKKVENYNLDTKYLPY